MQKDKKPIGLASSLGEVALMQGDFAKAKALAEQDLAIDPKFAMANRIYGLALASTGKFEQSIAPLNKAYEQHAFQARVSRESGCLCGLGRQMGYRPGAVHHCTLGPRHL